MSIRKSPNTEEYSIYLWVWNVRKQTRRKHQGAVSLTYLSILKEGFTPIFSATLSYGKRAFYHKKTGVTFPISLGKHRPSITFHIALIWLRLLTQLEGNVSETVPRCLRCKVPTSDGELVFAAGQLFASERILPALVQHDLELQRVGSQLVNVLWKQIHHHVTCV